MTLGGKPLELPGFYWDEERNRYFPIASKPKRKAIDDIPIDSQVAYTDRGGPQLRPTTTSRYLKASRAGTSNFSARVRIADELEGISLVKAYTEIDPPVRPLTWQSTKLTSFHAATIDGTLYVLAGDSRGVLHCSRAVLKNGSRAGAGPDRFNNNSRLFTSYHLGTGSPVEQIVASGNLAVVASSTCDSCLLAVRNLNAPDDSGVSFSRVNDTGDIRAASLSDRSLVLGLSKKLVWLKDIALHTKKQRVLHTKSDVLSVVQKPNTITAGLRNGEVRLFDVRTRGDASTELLGSRFTGKTGSGSPVKDARSKGANAAITHLQAPSDWELLVGTSSGELEMFDLRFASSTGVQPVLSFRGHVNSYSLDLGITTDPTSSILLAAGQDRRIRAWSLKTGEQLGTLLDGSQVQSPAKAVAVTQRDNTIRGAKWLWIAQEDEIRVVRLGGSDS